MMMTVVYLIFLIPIIILLNSTIWLVFQMGLLILIIMFFILSVNSYFSSISYFLGVDYYSYGLIILSIFIVCLMIISSNMIFKSLNLIFFLLMNLSLCFILFMIFCSLNFFLMYMFFEFSLIPLMILIFGWGYQPERLISGLYLFFYTLFASLPLLLILLYIYMMNGSLFLDWSIHLYTMNFIIHFSLIFAFLVKLPMFMVHFWLPKAHVQAPVSGSMILAGLLLKIGGYGILRTMFIFENLFNSFSYVWYSLSILGGLLVSLVCLIQGDVKCLIAYSSISHMSLCLMGLLSMTKWGVVGSYFLMISHGLCSSGLFCLANISYDRLFSRSFYLNKGILTFMPSMCMMWFIFSSFNMGCPPSLNFLSEIFILNSMMSYWLNSLFFFLFISFFSACFSIYLFMFTQHGSSSGFYCFSSGYTREYLLLNCHLFPLVFILFGLNSFLI
uniref:NADH-ubiquinone oxidoreductase chain 4 n=1 Tax=Illinigina sp. EMHAU-15062817 TaxID=2040461 RepID=A0A343KGK7_9HEMI|nr:NADH dehydrogenase subunit 4 [Illinigina sp. EMHAU-15062817]